MNTDLTCLYDGSFTGLLTAVALCETQDTFITLARSRDAIGLFDEPVEIRQDEAKADAVWSRLLKITGRQGASLLLEAFASDISGADSASANTALLLLKKGNRVLDDLGNPHILAADKAAHRSRAVAHLFLGLSRFSELADGTYYAPIEPDCDILPLVAAHFANRLSSQTFALHDCRRRKALLHIPGSEAEILADFETAWKGSMPVSEREREIQALWKQYFSMVSIRERSNPRLQMSHMPKKYWKYLPEKL